MIERESLISYAMSFASFLLDSKIGTKISKIILFGSVARGDFDEASDIDIFVDTNAKIEKDVDRLMTLFMSSKTYEAWKLKGVKNDISVKTGYLEKWSLRREIISSGILLYGKYNELPKNAKYYEMIKIDLKKFKTSDQVRIWRKLYGYRQKIGNKVYIGKGIVEKAVGKKIGKAIILVPMENRREIMEFLKKNKINFTVNELWSDTF